MRLGWPIFYRETEGDMTVAGGPFVQFTRVGDLTMLRLFYLPAYMRIGRLVRVFGITITSNQGPNT